MYMQGKMVHPDKRKGLAYVYQSDDALMHFCWKERSSATAEEDLIIFPDDCEYKRVSQCTTGRVYVLRFKSNNRRIFFWMQVIFTTDFLHLCLRIFLLLLFNNEIEKYIEIMCPPVVVWHLLVSPVINCPLVIFFSIFYLL